MVLQSTVGASPDQLMKNDCMPRVLCHVKLHVLVYMYVYSKSTLANRLCVGGRKVVPTQIL